MRRQILFLILSACLLPPQLAGADVNLTGTAVTYGVLGRGLTWAGTVNNNFLIDTNSSSIGACLTFNNNDGSSHTFTFAAFVTPDRALTTFTGSTSKWTAVPITQSPTYTVAANGTLQLYVNLPAAARATFQIGGGGGASTVDVFYTLTPIPCGVGPSGTSSICDSSASVTVATGTIGVIVAAPATGFFIHVCAYSVTGNSTAGVLNFFGTGAAGACGASTKLWGLETPTAGSMVVYQLGSGSGQLFQTKVAAQPLCFTNGAGSNYEIAVSYQIS